MNFVRLLLIFKLKLFSLFRYLYYSLNPLIKIGKKTLIEKNVVLNVLYGGTITIGEFCELRCGAQLLTYGGNIKIGNHSTVNPYTMIYGQGNVDIGNYVRIAAHCTIIPSNHVFVLRTIPICKQGLINHGIIIKNDVWIGTGVRVLDGVTIETGCVIGAGSVVVTSTEPYGIYVGVPARKIRMRK